MYLLIMIVVFALGYASIIAVLVAAGYFHSHAQANADPQIETLLLRFVVGFIVILSGAMAFVIYKRFANLSKAQKPALKNASVLVSQAHKLTREGKTADAEEVYKQALSMQEAHLDQNNPAIARTLAHLADLYADHRQTEKQQVLLRFLSIAEAYYNTEVKEPKPGIWAQWDFTVSAGRAEALYLLLSALNYLQCFSYQQKSYKQSEEYFVRLMELWWESKANESSANATIVSKVAESIRVYGNLLMDTENAAKRLKLKSISAELLRRKKRFSPDLLNVPELS